MEREQHGQTRRSVWPMLRWLFVGWLCLKVAGCVMMVPGPWGPEVGGPLPNGFTVVFQARPVGRETDDRLTVVAPDSGVSNFWVDRVHAGFDHVTVRYLDDGHRLWIESEGRIGASIDLDSMDFRAETNAKHDWAEIGAGTILDEGRTSSLLWLIGPW